MFKRGLIYAFLVFLLLSGCAPSGSAKNEAGKKASEKSGGSVVENAGYEELNKLLPEKAGFKWVYNGFAEYGHSMVLDKIEKDGNSIRYLITGEVDDMSAGESGGDFSLEIEYVIKDGFLIQKKKETMMLDSISDEIQLIKTPLEEGTSWKQSVSDKEGRKYDLNCRIAEVKEENGKREYTVLYEDENSDYFEKRVIREGVGIVSVEKLLVLESESFPVGYFLYEEASGYGKQE